MTIPEREAYESIPGDISLSMSGNESQPGLLSM